MTVDVAFLPGDLKSQETSAKAVVVFDVLRATTSMIAALAAGVKEIRIFGDLDAAAAAARASGISHLLCGERRAVRPPGFDLGNSPGAFDARLHLDQTLYMSTTNGTKAVLAAAAAKVIFIGALVNAAVVAEALIQTGLKVILLCAGTDGQVATEDVLGAGAVIESLQSRIDVGLVSDAARMAHRLFLAERGDLPAALANSQGGRNVLNAGLAQDIGFSARLNAIPVVGVVKGQPPVVARYIVAT